MDKIRIFFPNGAYVDAVPPKLWSPCEDDHCKICSLGHDPKTLFEAHRILSEAGFDLGELETIPVFWRVIRDEDAT